MQRAVMAILILGLAVAAPVTVTASNGSDAPHMVVTIVCTIYTGHLDEALSDMDRILGTDIADQMDECATSVEFVEAAAAPSVVVDMQEGALFPACADDDSCFVPHTVTVDVGGEVVWTNSDTVLHTVTEPGGLFDGWLFPGEEFSHTFEEAGTYAYGCTVHPWASAVVVVESAGTDALEPTQQEPAAGVEEATAEWEVWLSDQSDSHDIDAENPTGTYGSRIVIYESSDILAASPGTYHEDHAEFAPTVVEAADLFPNAKEELGVSVQRLHGMLPHPSHKYMNANFFGPGAGLVGIIDADPQCASAECDRIQAKALFRTTGPEGSQPSNHMSFWTPDGTKMIVANLGAKLLERIDYDQTTDTFTFNKAATLDLVGGRDLTAMEAMADTTLPAGQVSGAYSNTQPTTTPSGAPKEEAGLRSNNVVVCPIPSSNSKHAYVTFGGGGLFVVDTDTEPMSIVAEYTNDVISVAGCGGVTDGEFMYLNAGVSASGAGSDDSTFIMYRLPLDYPEGPVDSITPNYPPVVKFFEEKILNIPIENEMQLAERRDAHGLVISPPGAFPDRYLYQFDRIQNNLEIFDTSKIIDDPRATLAEQKIAHMGTIDLTNSGLCVGDDYPFVNQDGAAYKYNNDPAPDLADVSPDGEQIIVSFRGPHPVTVKHAGLGSCPGFGVVSLDESGTAGELTHVFRTFVPDATGTENLSDIHAAAIRLKGPT